MRARPTNVTMAGATRSTLRNAFVAALLIFSFAGGTPWARADASDYQFELVDQDVKQGYGTVVTVRLVHRTSGKVVPDALVFISRVDMSPDGMGAMTAPLAPVPDTLPGYYRFETDLVMAGEWALSLVATIPGESGYAQSKLVLNVVQ